MRGNNNAPHFWNFLVDQHGQTWYFSMFYWWHRLLKAEVYADVYGKVFRQRFSLNRDMMDSLRMPLDSVHPVFRYPFFEDVTRLYATDKAFTLSVGKQHLARDIRAGEVVYICMSDRYVGNLWDGQDMTVPMLSLRIVTEVPFTVWRFMTRLMTSWLRCLHLSALVRRTGKWSFMMCRKKRKMSFC